MTVEAKSCGRYSERRGYNLNTVSGHPIWPANPYPEDVRTVDIAWSQARICRFNGHLKMGVWFSLAQHSLEVYKAVTLDHLDDIPLRRAALFHDGEEYAEGDKTTPLKKMDLAFYEAVKYHIGDVLLYSIEDKTPSYFRRVERQNKAIAEKYNFGVELFDHPAIKRADYRAFLTEKRDLLNVITTDFGEDMDDPFPHKIEPLSFEDAAQEFLNACREVGINY